MLTFVIIAYMILSSIYHTFTYIQLRRLKSENAKLFSIVASAENPAIEEESLDAKSDNNLFALTSTVDIKIKGFPFTLNQLNQIREISRTRFQWYSNNKFITWKEAKNSWENHTVFCDKSGTFYYKINKNKICSIGHINYDSLDNLKCISDIKLVILLIDPFWIKSIIMSKS